MDIDPASLLSGLLHELDGLIEAAFNVFSHVIFKMEGEVLDALVNVVVGAVVCSTIYDVGDLVFLELLVVSRYDIASEVEEII